MKTGLKGAALAAFSVLGALVASGEDAKPALPEGAVRRLGSANLRHQDRLADLQFSADGKTILSASVDAVLLSSSAETGDPVAKPVGSYGHHRSIAIAPDGKRFVGGCYTHGAKEARIDLVEVPPKGRPRELEGHTGDVMDLAFAPGGATFASASMDGTVRTWDAATGAPKKSVEAHAGGARCVAYSPDGTLLATGGADKDVHLLAAASLEKKATLAKKHKSPVTALAFSPDGQTLFSVDVGWMVRATRVSDRSLLWEKLASDRGEKRDVFDLNWEAWCNIAVSPDGKLLAFPDGKDSVGIFDGATGKTKTHVVLEGGTLAHACRLRFSPDGALLAVGTDHGTVRIFEWKTEKERALNAGHESSVQTIAFSPDGTLLASGSADTTVRLWAVASGEVLGVLEGHTDEVTQVVFSADGKTLASGSQDGTARTWDPKKRSKRSVLAVRGSGQRNVSSIALSPNGTEIAIASWDDKLHIMDASEGDELRVFETGMLRCLAYDAKGETIAALGRRSDEAVLLDAATGEKRSAVKVEGSPWALARSPDGKLLAVSCDAGLRLLDAATGAEKRVIPLEKHGSMTAVAFSPDGKLLGAAGHGGYVEILDAASGERLARYGELHPIAWNTAVAFSPDGKLLASAAHDSSITLWKVPAK